MRALDFAQRLIKDLTLLGVNTYHHIYASSKTNKVTATLITRNVMFMDMGPDIPVMVGDCKYLSLLFIKTNTNDEFQIRWMVSAISPSSFSSGGHSWCYTHVRR